MTKHLDLDTLVLFKGAHLPDGQMCVMEAVAFFAHEPWSDNPACASKVIGAFLRGWNDGMNDEDRQLLKPYIPRLVGTAASAEIERKRSYLALDWYCRVSVPTWLRLIGKNDEAVAIEACAPITDAKTARAATGALQKGAKLAQAAGAAAGAAAGDALRPTIIALQASAFDLLDRMIALSDKKVAA